MIERKSLPEHRQKLPQTFTMQMRVAANFYYANEVCGKVSATSNSSPKVCMVKVCGKLICMVKVCWKGFAASLPQCSPESLFVGKGIKGPHIDF